MADERLRKYERMLAQEGVEYKVIPLPLYKDLVGALRAETMRLTSAIVWLGSRRLGHEDAVRGMEHRRDQLETLLISLDREGMSD